LTDPLMKESKILSLGGEKTSTKVHEVYRLPGSSVAATKKFS